MSKLTNKQKRFCEEYLIDFNATQAAIRAGYKESSAKQIGSENLTKLDIQKFIQEKQQETSERLEITKESILKDFQTIYDESYTEGLKGFQHALRAKELQCKMIGGFNEDQSDKAKIEININLTDD